MDRGRGRVLHTPVIRRGSAIFYFPIVTCIVVSVGLAIVGALLQR